MSLCVGVCMGLHLNVCVCICMYVCLYVFIYEGSRILLNTRDPLHYLFDENFWNNRRGQTDYNTLVNKHFVS